MVRLYDDGDLSGGSLSEADHRRLHGQTAVPASPPHYLPHLYPPPSQHSTAGLHLSVRPHPGGYLGFFLMGYLLGHYSPGRRMRAVIYCGGVIGYLWGVLGNLWTSSPKQVPLPFNGGYSLNHYLCAAACSCSVKRFAPTMRETCALWRKCWPLLPIWYLGSIGYTC